MNTPDIERLDRLTDSAKRMVRLGPLVDHDTPMWEDTVLMNELKILTRRAVRLWLTLKWKALFRGSRVRHD